MPFRVGVAGRPRDLKRAYAMDDTKVREIEEKIADLKARWPAHSVPPSLWMELEALEEELK
ncbi:MAG: hypothetical protein ABSH25_14930, partial [Syntrophorhabdales bacterium]